jgi:hypothetical protein
MVTFSSEGISQLSHRKMSRDYERKILEKEKGWRLAEKMWGEIHSKNIWGSPNGHIVIEIHKCDSPEDALKLIQGMKTAHAAGTPHDIQGLGDAAYELSARGTVRSIAFVKRAYFVTVVPDSAEKVGVDAMRRFARHVLDAIEGK